MTYTPNTPPRQSLFDDPRLRQAARFAGPAMAFARRNPFVLIGAAVVGAAGVLAWRNREQIAAKAQPLIDDARAKGHALIEDARTKGEELIDQAKSAGEAVAAKAGRTRRTAAGETAPNDLH